MLTFHQAIFMVESCTVRKDGALKTPCRKPLSHSLAAHEDDMMSKPSRMPEGCGTSSRPSLASHQARLRLYETILRGIIARDITGIDCRDHQGPFR